MELLDHTREWLLFDWLFLGMFLLAFASNISKLIIIVWDRIHPSSINSFNNWLQKRGF